MNRREGYGLEGATTSVQRSREEAKGRRRHRTPETAAAKCKAESVGFGYANIIEATQDIEGLSTGHAPPKRAKYTSRPGERISRSIAMNLPRGPNDIPERHDRGPNLFGYNHGA